MHKSICLSIFIVFFTLLSTASKKPEQYQITGQVIEHSTGQAIPYATITLLNDSGTVITKLCSEVSGNFSINATEKISFKLLFSAVGYTEEEILGEITSATTHVGIVKLKEGVALKELAVTAQKPLIKVDVDKITYNLESDPESKVNNALEMMRKVPLLAVDGDDNVTLNGQSNFKVLVNGKSSSLMSKNFKDVLKSMPASSIKDIEVITNPSSKYEAEGVGGIINIITMKKTLNGYNGSVNGGYDTFGAANFGLYISAKVNKLGFSGRYSFYDGKRPDSHSNSVRENYHPAAENQYYMRTNDKRQEKGNSQSFSGELSYDIDSLNLITASFWGYKGIQSNNGTSKTTIANSQNITQSEFSMLSSGKMNYGSLSGNIDYQKTFMKPDKTFTLSYLLDNSPYDNDIENKIVGIQNYENSEQKTLSKSYTREQTLQVDYYDPISEKHQVECGVKAIYRQNFGDSDHYLFNAILNEMQLVPEKSNELTYNQTIVGLYAGYVFKLKKLSFKSGLRAELSWNDAISKSATDTSFTNRLKNLVPYLNFNYKLNDASSLKLSYTQRLYRPSIWYLNPYKDRSNPLMINYGNPNLKSEISHAYELGYNYFKPKFNLDLTATCSNSNNSIEQIIFIDNDNIQNFTFDNIGKDMRLGLNTYLSFRPSGKFNLNFNGGLYYSQISTTHMEQQISNSGINYRASLNTRVTLWKDAAINLSGGYFSPSVRLQGQSSGYLYNSIGLSQHFLNRKLMLNLSLSNPLSKEYKFSYSSSSPEFNFTSNNFYPARSLRLNLSYNFGKMDETVKKAKRGIQNDDVKGGGKTGN